MGRPKTTLISPERAFAAALRIIDGEGLEGLTIRRIGEELKVNGISLYHHFSGKDEIVVGACRLALADVRTPRDPNAHWREWVVENAARYWEALRAHPNLIPVMLRRQSLGIGQDEHARSAGLLAIQGVPLPAIMPLLDGLESLAFGCAATEWADSQQDRNELRTRHPILFYAARARGLSRRCVFKCAAKTMIDAIVAEIPCRPEP